jgi:hypothetical protein
MGVLILTVYKIHKFSIANAPVKCYILRTTATKNYFKATTITWREGPLFETEVGQQEELFDRTLASRFILEVLLYELTWTAGRDAVAGRRHGEASTLCTIY